MINKFKTIFLVLIVIGGFAFRLYRLSYPLMDWHSFRQADTASVTREFIKHHYPIWRPHYQDLGSMQSGLDNLEGDRMVEFPLVNYAIAQTIRFFPQLALVSFSRFISTLASTGSIICLYFLIKYLIRQEDETVGELVALISSAAFAFLPYSIYYGRTILPEPFQVFFGLLALLSFTWYLEKKTWQNWLITCLALMAALLVKPTTVFWGPLFLLLAWQHDGHKIWSRGDLWLLAIVSVLPLLWWRTYIQQFPAGIPASSWLLNGPMHGTPPRWRPMWWRWLFYERLTKMWLGYIGIIFVALGLLPSSWRRGHKIHFSSSDWFAYLWSACGFAYLSVFATGNIQHDYYQYLLLPGVCLLLGRGVYKFCELFHEFIIYKSIKNKWTHLLELLAICLILGAWHLSWRQIRGNFNVNNWEQVRLGQQADRLLPSEALVIADSGTGDTNFLFQTNRRGWPDALDLDHYISGGAQYLIGTNTDDFYHFLEEHYELVFQNDDGFIFDLTASHSATTEATLVIETDNL